MGPNCGTILLNWVEVLRMSKSVQCSSLTLVTGPLWVYIRIRKYPDFVEVETGAVNPIIMESEVIGQMAIPLKNKENFS